MTSEFKLNDLIIGESTKKLNLMIIDHEKRVADIRKKYHPDQIREKGE
jgi:hypothetical protein